MSATRESLIDLRERLEDFGLRVPGRADAFHRERTDLLAEVADALSWRGLLARGRSALDLGARTEALGARAQTLLDLFAQIARCEERLALAQATLARIKTPALSAADCIPARTERIRAAMQPLGRQAASEEALQTERRRCDEQKAEADRLCEALDLVLAAEDAVARIRSGPRTAALESALPDLAARLCREGPTPAWRTEIKALVEPLERLAGREQPREIRETDKIVKDLARWAKLLGQECDACAELSARFMARRRDWPGEDDRTFAALFEEARRLEQSMLEKAAAVRAAGIDELAGRCALLAELVAPDQRLAEQLEELKSESPDNPRDHEDWCEQLREASAVFLARVKRCENELLARLVRDLADCRGRLETLRPRPRLAAQDAELARLQDAFEALERAGQLGDALALLAAVEQVRDLRGKLMALESAIRQDQADLETRRSQLQRQAQWLAGRARGLGIALPTADALDALAAPPRAAQGGQAVRDATALEQQRQTLEQDASGLALAQADFVRICGAEIESANRRLGRAARVLDPQRASAGGLDLAPLPVPTTGASPSPADCAGLADHLERLIQRLARADALLAAEEQARTARLAELREALAAIQPERLGHNDRGDRETVLRMLERQAPSPATDPAERIESLGELCEGALHLLRRLEGAARRMEERRESARERLRRLAGLFLQGYCPELYLRVEALLHPPPATRWPRDAEEWQLAEAERLLGLLERQSLRLAARESALHLEALGRRARRTGEPEAAALVEELAALPPEQPAPPRLRRRLAELAEANGMNR